MDLEDDTTEMNSVNKDEVPSDNSASSDSSGILHAVSQGDTIDTQMVMDSQTNSIQQMQETTGEQTNNCTPFLHPIATTSDADQAYPEDRPRGNTGLHQIHIDNPHRGKEGA